MNRTGEITVLNPDAACSPLRWKIPALTAPVAWQALQATATHDGRAAVKVFLGGQPAPLSALLAHAAAEGPAPLDAERFMALPGPSFCYGRNVQAWHRPLFETVVEALTRHVVRTGLGSGPVEAEVFAGNYPRTPGGVHREACSNIHLVLAGTKIMHLWTGDGWMPAGTRRRRDVAAGTGTQEEYLPTLNPASVLTAGNSLTSTAGHGFAWTAGTWHIAETQGPAIALNVASYQSALHAEPSLPIWADRLDGAVPPAFLDRYRRHVGGESLPLAAVLGRLSALAMRPAAARRPERPARLVTPRLAAPVVWARTDNDDLLVAALGAVRRLPPTTPVDWLTGRWGAAEVAVPEASTGLARWLCQQGVLDALEEQ
ncbi:MAG TPA: hypothetical protein VFC00_26245 [Micromonosporaceae bacterium]|nr:hypothetical protein [Micromonosporaceae bacterium]